MNRIEESYSIFIATVRKYAIDQMMKLELAISKAIDECIEKNVLRDILIDQRGAVMNYILESFDKEIYERDLRENIRNEVIAEVREELMDVIRSEVETEVRENVKAEVETEVRNKVKAEIRNDLIKDLLEKGVSAEIIAAYLPDNAEEL